MASKPSPYQLQGRTWPTSSSAETITRRITRIALDTLPARRMRHRQNTSRPVQAVSLPSSLPAPFTGAASQGHPDHHYGAARQHVLDSPRPVPNEPSAYAYLASAVG